MRNFRIWAPFRPLSEIKKQININNHKNNHFAKKKKKKKNASKLDVKYESLNFGNLVQHHKKFKTALELILLCI